MREQGPGRRSRSVTLPPPPFARAILFAALGALVGATAWGLMAFYLHHEHGLVAWAIGGLIGFATVRAGGHGTALACCAGVLALLAIASGKQVAFRMFVAKEADALVAKFDTAAHEEHTKDAADWVALGATPTDDQVKAFQRTHGFDAESPRRFVAETGAELRSFAERKPTLDQWRDEVKEQVRDEASFFDYLREDFHPYDVLFVVLGVMTAFGMVSKATAALRLAAQQAARAEAEAAAAAAAPPEDAGGDAPR